MATKDNNGARENGNGNGNRDNRKSHIPADAYKIEELKTLSLAKLIEIATKLGVENPQEYRRQDLMFRDFKNTGKSSRIHSF